MEPANQSLKADRALPLLLVNLTVRSFNVSPVNDEPEPCQLIDSGRNRFLIVVFTVIFCVSLIGNSLVILTIVQNRWMRTITNLFLLNMAISDLLLTVICMPPTLTAMLFECFIWGGRMKWMCTLMSFLQPVSVAANANTLVAIALERYFALCRPLHSRQWQTKSNVVRMLIVIWTAACITSIPPTFVVEVIEIRPGQPNCRYNWPSPQAPLIYFIFLSQMVFTIPLIIMTLLYSLVIRSLWLGIKQHNEHSIIAQTGQKIENSGTDCNSVSAATQLDNKSKDYRWPKKWSKSKSLLRWKYPHLKKELANSVTTIPLANVSQSSSPVAPAISSHGNPSPRPQGRWSGAQLRSTHTEKSLVTKKRVIKMLAMIVVEFFVCWMPFYAYYLIVIIHPSLFDSSCHVAFLIIAYLSTCTNPITYCFMNSKFRQAFLAAFGCHVNSKALRRQRCYGTRHNQPCVYKVTPPQETPDNVQQEDNEDDDDESDSSSQQDYVTAYEGSRNSSEDRTTFQLMLTDGSFVQTSPAVEKADHTKLPIIKMEGSAKIV
uniref:G_PROTEIN_RECEP_F1_2 domain-containing protein n=1 Tax=Trichuris muris TaxID=70415 RepID=A0A5S6QK88_TRIMR